MIIHVALLGRNSASRTTVLGSVALSEANPTISKCVSGLDLRGFDVVTLHTFTMSAYLTDLSLTGRPWRCLGAAPHSLVWPSHPPSMRGLYCHTTALVGHLDSARM